MKIEYVSVTSESLSTGIIVLTGHVKVKNSIIPRTYVVRKWPSNTKIRHSMMCCSFIALLTRLSERRIRLIYPFFTVNQNNIIWSEQAGPNTEFVKFLHNGLRNHGAVSGDKQLYSHYWTKRGVIQLYCSLRITDKHVLEIMQLLMIREKPTIRLHNTILPW